MQEDIVPAKKKVTVYRRYRYWCPCCRLLVESPVGGRHPQNLRRQPHAQRRERHRRPHEPCPDLPSKRRRLRPLSPQSTSPSSQPCGMNFFRTLP
ncbi:MAG: IS66 family transposase zinc-finger binding domain-containing protein [bacterium]